ncbi:MAG: response regulator [Bacteroidota bacterium]
MRKKTKILIIEDDLVNRQLLIAILEEFDVEIFEALNGLIGVQLANEINPNLILLDINMPTIDGFETIAKIRENTSLKSIPIIACTASSNKINDEKINSIFDAKINKPYTLECINKTIRRFIPDFGNGE